MKRLILVLMLLGSSCGQDNSPSDIALAATDTSSTRGEKGDKGDTGATGATGPQGEKGDKGDKGDIGPDGPDGIDGAAGPAGSTGPAGTNGTSGNAQVIVNMSGDVIGNMFYFDPTTNSYWTSNSSNQRFEIVTNTGAFPNAYLLFSGANCTGTKRLYITASQWANVYIDGRDSSLIKSTGANLGSFNYQSVVAQGTSCANSSGSKSASYATQVPTLNFTYPAGQVYIQN